MELTRGLGEPRETRICCLTQVGLVPTPEPSGPLDPPSPGPLWFQLHRTRPTMHFGVQRCELGSGSEACWPGGVGYSGGGRRRAGLCLKPCSCQAVPLRVGPTISGHLVLA